MSHHTTPTPLYGVLVPPPLSQMSASRHLLPTPQPLVCAFPVTKVLVVEVIYYLASA